MMKDTGKILGNRHPPLFNYILKLYYLFHKTCCDPPFLFLGQDSPINKLLYARDIPRYKQMVER